MSAVSISSLSWWYGDDQVLENVDLTVEEGDFLALLGPNGGGKTTLLRLILGLLPAPDGRVTVFGRSPARARDSMGYVPQYASLRLDYPATVLDVTLMGACRPGSSLGAWPENRIARERAGHVLETVGIADLGRRGINALSGGQRQRLLVARALMGRTPDKPFLLLLDEPTASIDPQGKFCFYEFLQELSGSITIVVVSHDLGMATPFFSKVALVNREVRVLPEGKPTAESLQALFGSHGENCPLNLLAGLDQTVNAGDGI